MSLSGTGNGGQYWSGASPSLTFGSRPFSISLWYQETSSFTKSASHCLQLFGSSSLACTIPVITQDPNVQLYDLNDNGAGGYVFYNGSNLSTHNWYHFVFILANGGSDCIYQNAAKQTLTGSITQASPPTLDMLALPGYSYAPMNTTALIGEVTIWSGALSAADVGKLHGGGSGAHGVNPLSLSSTSGASLLRYYLRNGNNDFTDHSGRGGATLVSQGGAAPSWSGNNPPVNAAASAGTLPLLTCFW